MALLTCTSDWLRLPAGQFRLHCPSLPLLSVYRVARPFGVITAQRIDEYPLRIQTEVNILEM